VEQRPLVKNFALIGAAGYIAPRHLQAISDNGGRALEPPVFVNAQSAPELGSRVERTLRGREYHSAAAEALKRFRP
jgi:hypothetical protein